MKVNKTIIQYVSRSYLHLHFVALYIEESTTAKVSASNWEDQRTYNNIASLVFVELDCIQFDYIL